MRSVLLWLAVGLFCKVNLLAAAAARPAIEWQKVFGGAGSDTPFSVRQLADGGFIVGGNSESGAAASKISPTFGQNDYWLVRLDASGVKLWDRSYGSAAYDRFYEVELSTDGGFFLGGYSQPGVSGSKTNAGNVDDGWLIRVDQDGNELWQRCIGGLGYDSLESLAAGPAGGVVLGCNSSSSVGGNKTEPAFGRGDVWIVGVDHAGELLWQKSYGGTNSEFGLRIRAVPAGGYVVACMSDSSVSGNKTSAGLGSYDYWVLRLDAEGNKLWDVALGGSGYEVLVDIKPTGDGGFLVGGHGDSSPSGNRSAPAYGAGDIWIVKLNAAGEILWDRSYGGTGLDSLCDMAETTDGGLLLGCESASSINGTKTTASYGGFDYWLIRLDAGGQELWQASYGGDRSDTGPRVMACADGSFFVCGASYSGVSGNKTIPSLNGSIGYDYWALKLGPDVARLTQMNGPTMAPDGFHLQLSGPPNVYEIECSSDLVTWSPLQTNQLVNAAIQLVDAGATNVPGRFYRLKP